MVDQKKARKKKKSPKAGKKDVRRDVKKNVRQERDVGENGGDGLTTELTTELTTVLGQLVVQMRDGADARVRSEWDAILLDNVGDPQSPVPVWMWFAVRIHHHLTQTPHAHQSSWLHADSSIVRDVRLLTALLTLYNLVRTGDTAAVTTLNQLVSSDDTPEVVRTRIPLLTTFERPSDRSGRSLERYLNALDLSALTLLRRCSLTDPAWRWTGPGVPIVLFPVMERSSVLKNVTPFATLPITHVVLLESGLQRRNLRTNDLVSLEVDMTRITAARALAAGWVDWDAQTVTVMCLDLAWPAPRPICLQLDEPLEWVELNRPERDVPLLTLLTLAYNLTILWNKKMGSVRPGGVIQTVPSGPLSYVMQLHPEMNPKIVGLFRSIPWEDVVAVLTTNYRFQPSYPIHKTSDWFRAGMLSYRYCGILPLWRRAFEWTDVVDKNDDRENSFSQSEVLLLEQYAQHSINMRLLRGEELLYSVWPSYPWPDQMDSRWSYRTWDDYYSDAFGADVRLPGGQRGGGGDNYRPQLQLVREAFEQMYCVAAPSNVTAPISAPANWTPPPWFHQTTDVQVGHMFYHIGLSRQKDPRLWVDGTVGEGSFTVAMRIRGIGNAKQMVAFPKPLVGRYRLCMSNNRRMTSSNCRTMRSFPNLCAVDHYQVALQRLLMCCESDWDVTLVPALYDCTVFAPRQKLNFVLQFVQHVADDRENWTDHWGPFLGHGLVFAAAMSRLGYRHQDLHTSNMLVRKRRHGPVLQRIAVQLGNGSWLLWSFVTPYRAVMIDLDRAIVSPFYDKPDETVHIYTKEWREVFPTTPSFPDQPFPSFHSTSNLQNVDRLAFLERAYQTNRETQLPHFSMHHFMHAMEQYRTMPQRAVPSLQYTQDVDPVEMCDVNGTFLCMLTSALEFAKRANDIPFQKHMEQMFAWSVQCPNSTAALYWNAHLLGFKPTIVSHLPTDYKPDIRIPLHAWDGPAVRAAVSPTWVHQLTTIQYAVEAVTQ